MMFLFTFLLLACLGLITALITFCVYKFQKAHPDASPRLRSYFGIGTTFYGATDRADDGSFLTTEWFTVVLLPIIPINTYRVSFGWSDTSFVGWYTTTKQYYIHSREKLSRVQLARTYGLYAGSMLLLIGIMELLMLLFPDMMSGEGTGFWMGMVIIMIVMCAWFIAFIILAVRFWRTK